MSRVNSRLEEVARNLKSYSKSGAIVSLISEGRGRLADAADYLIDARNGLAIGSLNELGRVRHMLLIAEAAVGPVDYVIIPVLRSRTKSDHRYEKIIQRLLEELGIQEVTPLTIHHSLLGPLAVNHTFGHIPVFVFSPANRSLLTMSLLYHEIGHWVFSDLLDPDERSTLTQEIRQFAGKKVDSTEQALQEIAADVFAGLVGGYTFVSSLCCVLLGQQSLLATTDLYYPSPSLRIALARWASQHAGDPDATMRDPLMEAWDFYVAQSRKQGDLRDKLISSAASKDFTIHFAEVLASHGIRLSDTNAGLVGIRKDGPAIDPRSCTIPTLLRAACRFRATTDNSTYWKWELQVVKDLGLADK